MRRPFHVERLSDEFGQYVLTLKCACGHERRTTPQTLSKLCGWEAATRRMSQSVCDARCAASGNAAPGLLSLRNHAVTAIRGIEAVRPGFFQRQHDGSVYRRTCRSCLDCRQALSNVSAIVAAVGNPLCARTSFGPGSLMAARRSRTECFAGTTGLGEPMLHSDLLSSGRVSHLTGYVTRDVVNLAAQTSRELSRRRWLGVSGAGGPR